MRCQHYSVATISDVLVKTSMSFKITALWKAAFEISRTDATPEEQAHLAGCYDAMRTRASMLVAKIAGDLPNMTVHDVTHLDALWEMAAIAAGARISSSTLPKRSCSAAQFCCTMQR